MTELKKAKIKALQKFIEEYTSSCNGSGIHINNVALFAPDSIECQVVYESARLVVHYGSEYCVTNVNDIHSLWYMKQNGSIVIFE